ncbi:DUF2911 domain-containing protein [Maribacter litopenaei]|uniref:DUF2911 domain-containing protein n=1 Tax=Maribacter litopenaei TaxID=2976127 RepID=UPI003B845BA2
MEYSRPAARGRKIFGFQADGQPALVPYGRIWRVGANESTKITFDTDVKVNGQSLPKGQYALYVFPYSEYWDLVFHMNITHWGDGRNNYDPKEDVLRVRIRPITTLVFQENLLISFDEIGHDSVKMVIQWARTKADVLITFDTYEIMRTKIERTLKENPTAQTYYEVARYYQEEGIHLAEAISYLEKALEKGGETYYFYRVKSLVEGDLGYYDAAIQSANKSLKLAAMEDKDEFVRLNQKSIKTWEDKLENN